MSTQNAAIPPKQIYMQNGRTFSPVDAGAMTDLLPPGTYTVVQTMTGLKFEKINNYELPNKLYGDVERQATRILDTFIDRPASTGVLLSGQKGAGKTMLTKRLSQKAMQEFGIITIAINQPLCGEDFNMFIQSVEQPAVVIFDEFEKVYNNEEQSALLTLFDGTYSSKKLFILTSNRADRINDYMHNRPGRLFYALEFGSLEPNFIREYCQDNLKNKANINGVLTASSCFSKFSFDMLKALVEEMNRYNETATEAIQILNMKPSLDDYGDYDVSLIVNGSTVECNLRHATIRNPMSLKDFNIVAHLNQPKMVDTDDYDMDYLVNKVKAKSSEDGDDNAAKKKDNILLLNISSKSLAHIDPDSGTFVFNTQKADTQVMVKRRPPTNHYFNYDAV